MSIGSTNFNPAERVGSTNISEGSNVSSRENSATGASKHLLGRSLSRTISKKRKINTNSSMGEIKPSEYPKTLKNFNTRLNKLYQKSSKLSSQLNEAIYDKNPAGFKNAFPHKEAVFKGIGNAIKTLQESAKYSFEMSSAEKDNLKEILKNVYEQNEKYLDSDLLKVYDDALKLIEDFPNQPKTFDNEIKRRLAEVKNEIADRKKQDIATADLEKKLELLNSIKKIVQEGNANKDQVVKDLNTLRRLSGDESSASLVKDSVLLYMRKEYKDLKREYVENFSGVSSKISTMNSEIKNAMDDVENGTFGKPTEVRMSQGGKQEVIEIPYKDSLHIEGFPDKESRMKALEEMKGSMETIGKCFDDLVKASPEEREKMIKTIEDLSKNTKYLVIQDVCEDFIKTANFLILLDRKD